VPIPVGTLVAIGKSNAVSAPLTVVKRALLPALHLNRRQALNRLASLLGMTPYDLEPILREPGDIPTAPDQVVVGIPAELLRRRLDICGAERLIAQQSAQIGIAEAELYPQFALNGETKLNTQNFSDLFNTASVADAIKSYDSSNRSFSTKTPFCKRIVKSKMPSLSSSVQNSSPQMDATGCLESKSGRQDLNMRSLHPQGRNLPMQQPRYLR